MKINDIDIKEYGFKVLVDSYNRPPAPPVGVTSVKIPGVAGELPVSSDTRPKPGSVKLLADTKTKQELEEKLEKFKEVLFDTHMKVQPIKIEFDEQPNKWEIVYYVGELNIDRIVDFGIMEFPFINFESYKYATSDQYNETFYYPDTKQITDKLYVYKDGTIQFENMITDEKVYNKGITVEKPIVSLERLSYVSDGYTSPIDLQKATIAPDGLSFTIDNAIEGATIKYQYKDDSTLVIPEIEITYSTKNGDVTLTQNTDTFTVGTGYDEQGQYVDISDSIIEGYVDVVIRGNEQNFEFVHSGVVKCTKDTIYSEIQYVLNESTLKKVPNGTKDFIDLNYNKKVSDVYTLKENDILNLVTRTNKVECYTGDLTTFLSNAKSTSTNDIEGNILIDGWEEGALSSGSQYREKVWASATNNFIYFDLPLGTTLEEAKTMLTGLKLIYQLDVPVIEDIQIYAETPITQNTITEQSIYPNEQSFDWLYSRHMSGLYNHSHFETPIAISITGDVINPRIELEGTDEYMQFEIDLKGRTLNVNNDYTIDVDGKNGFPYLKGGDFFMLKKGDNGLIFKGGGPNAKVKYKWKHRF